MPLNVLFILENIATNHGNVANQSGQYVEGVESYGPYRAIDGNTNQDFNSGSCSYTSTNLGAPAWWYVDMGQLYSVKNVVIYRRVNDFNDGNTE